MLDLLLAPESFLLSERYASAVKTLGLAIFFMPVLPLGCVIALAGQPISHSLLPLGIHTVHLTDAMQPMLLCTRLVDAPSSVMK